MARAAILGSAFVLVAAAPAHAAAAISDALPSSCTSHGAVVCIYANSGFSGGPGIFSGTNYSWGAEFGSSNGACVAGVSAASDNRGGWNDCVSSIVNNTGDTFYFYLDNNCTSAIVWGMLPHTSISNLNANSNTAVFNDSLSSDSRGVNQPC
jgi:hypothetical protein